MTGMVSIAAVTHCFASIAYGDGPASQQEVTLTAYVAGVAFSCGGAHAVIAGITLEMFGSERYATNTGLFAFAAGLGSLALNGMAISFLDFVDLTTVQPGPGLACKGAHCFQSTFVALTVISVVGVLVSLPVSLWFTTDRSY